MLPFSAQMTRQITWFCLGFSNVVIGRKLPYLDSIEVHSSSILTFMAREPHIFFRLCRNSTRNAHALLIKRNWLFRWKIILVINQSSSAPQQTVILTKAPFATGGNPWNHLSLGALEVARLAVEKQVVD